MFKDNEAFVKSGETPFIGDKTIKIEKEVYQKINIDILSKMSPGDKFLFTSGMLDNMGERTMGHKLVTFQGMSEDGKRINIAEVGNLHVKFIAHTDNLLDKIPYEDFYKKMTTGSTFRFNDNVYTVLEKANNLQTITAVCNTDSVNVSISDFHNITHIQYLDESEEEKINKTLENNISCIPKKGDEITFYDNGETITGIFLAYSCYLQGDNPTLLLNVGDFHLEDVPYRNLKEINGKAVTFNENNIHDNRYSEKYDFKISFLEAEYIVEHEKEFKEFGVFDIIYDEFDGINKNTKEYDVAITDKNGFDKNGFISLLHNLRLDNYYSCSNVLFGLKHGECISEEKFNEIKNVFEFFDSNNVYEELNYNGKGEKLIFESRGYGMNDYYHIISIIISKNEIGAVQYFVDYINTQVFKEGDHISFSLTGIESIIKNLENQRKEAITSSHKDEASRHIDMYLTLLTDINEANNYGKIKSLNDASIKVEVNGNEYNLHTSTKHLLMKVNSLDALSEENYESYLIDTLESISRDSRSNVYYKGHNISVKWDGECFNYEDEQNNILEFKSTQLIKEFIIKNFEKPRMFTSLEEILPDHVVSKNIIDTMEDNIDGIKIDSFGNTLKNGEEEIGNFFYTLKHNDNMATFVKIDDNFYKCIFKYNSEL